MYENAQDNLVTIDVAYRIVVNEALNHGVRYQSNREQELKLALQDSIKECYLEMGIKVNVPNTYDEPLLIPVRYIKNILMPKTIAIFNRRKITNVDLEVVNEYESKYLQVTKKLEDDTSITEILILAKDFSKIVKITGNDCVYGLIKYVPSYWSNQSKYEDQYVDEMGVHYNTEEITTKLKRILNPIPTLEDRISKLEQFVFNTDKSIEENSTQLNQRELDKMLEEHLQIQNTIKIKEFYKFLQTTNTINFQLCSKDTLQKLKDKYKEEFKGIITRSYKDWDTVFEVWIPNLATLIQDLHYETHDMQIHLVEDILLYILFNDSAKSRLKSIL